MKFIKALVLFLAPLPCFAQAFFTGTIEYRLTYENREITKWELRERAENRVVFFGEHFTLVKYTQGSGIGIPFTLHRKNAYGGLAVFPHSEVTCNLETKFVDKPSLNLEYKVGNVFTVLDTTLIIAGIECIGFMSKEPVPPDGRSFFTVSWVATQLWVPLYCESEFSNKPAGIGGFFETPFIQLGEDIYRNGVLVERVQAVFISDELEFKRYGFSEYENTILGYEQRPRQEVRFWMSDWIKLRNASSFGG